MCAGRSANDGAARPSSTWIRACMLQQLHGWPSSRTDTNAWQGLGSKQWLQLLSKSRKKRLGIMAQVLILGELSTRFRRLELMETYVERTNRNRGALTCALKRLVVFVLTPWLLDFMCGLVFRVHIGLHSTILHAWSLVTRNRHHECNKQSALVARLKALHGQLRGCC